MTVHCYWLEANHPALVKWHGASRTLHDIYYMHTMCIFQGDLLVAAKLLVPSSCKQSYEQTNVTKTCDCTQCHISCCRGNVTKFVTSHCIHFCTKPKVSKKWIYMAHHCETSNVLNASVQLWMKMSSKIVWNGSNH